MSHTYLKYFEEQKAQMEARVALDTRRNRKAFAKLHITDKEGRPVTGVKVRVDQKSHDFKFGCNLFMLDQFPDEARNQAYRKEFKELFNYGIAPFYWADFELTDGAPRMGENPPDVYRRPAPEKILRYCGENGIDVKGHPLFWHKFLPDWLPEDRDESFYRLDRRLRELSSEYGDRIRDWDCVNESLTRPCNYMRDTRLPRDYPGSIFKKAAKYFTNNRLFINDVTEIAWDDELGELSAYHMQIENLLLKGTPVDAIGMQYHMFYTPEELEKRVGQFYNPECLFNCMDMYGSFGLPLHVSEVTVPAYGGTQENMELQARITEMLYRIWFSHEQMEGIVWWNLVDGTAAYAPFGSFDGENYYAGGLLNHDMTPKPVYHVLKHLIHEEWHTEEQIDSMPEAHVFEGFFGTYDVEVELNGETVRRELHLSKYGPREFTIEI